MNDAIHGKQTNFTNWMSIGPVDVNYSMVLRPVQRGYQFRSETDLLDKTRSLVGHTSGDVATALGESAWNDSPVAIGKAGVGTLVERYLGKTPDNLAEPDFAELGVELKTLPMKRSGRSWTVKEPTSLTFINYHELAEEHWPVATVRHKIERILWVPFEHHPTDKRASKFRAPFLWSPPTDDWTHFAADFSMVKSEVKAGRAHELSETMCDFLSARRKGARGQMTSQPFSHIPAKTRAWAFKAAYTRPILQREVLEKPFTSLVTDLSEISSMSEFTSYVEQKLRGFEGLTLRVISQSTGGRISGGKSGPADFVRNILGVRRRGAIEEFEKLGVRTHTVWVRPSDLKPWEATSFPAMSLSDFSGETWGDTELEDHLDRILFIPLFGESRSADDERILGPAFFWSPPPSDWAGIEKEWTQFQGLVNSGAAKYFPKLDSNGDPRFTKDGKPMRSNGLPNGSETTYIHMRPHGKNADDCDLDPLGNSVTKQCFWLNYQYVQSILKQAMPRLLHGRGPG